MKNHRHNRHAFTLIELLVVIAIIGLLSTIAIVSLGSSRTKARDTKRIADIHQISTAMQLYRQDNGNYPDPGALGCAGGSTQWFCLGYADAGTCWPSGAYHGCTALNNAIKPYMANIPDDPDLGNVGSGGDAYLYNFGTNMIVNAPLIHWGMENGPTSANTCLGGGFGTWPSGSYKDSKYWCDMSFPQ
jgi:prepilin-type N-terminal cleavage/methylation domain-containing protein